MKPFALHCTGALALGVWCWLAFVSRGDVTLRMLFGAVGAAWALLGVAWWCAREMAPVQVLRAVWIWGGCFRVAGFFGEPLLEDDWARYLWDGRQFVVSGNPYANAPSEHFADKSLPEPFQRVLSEINSPDVPTIYAPVCEYAFAVSHLIAPAKLWPWKLMLLAADLATLALLLRLVPPRHALLYAWCPLLIQETAFTAHPDSLWVFFLVAALYFFSKGNAARMAVCCGLALATKIFALLIVPFLLVRAAWKYRLLAIAVFAAAYLPFWLQGSAADFAGLRAMSGDWEFNSTVFAVLTHFIGAGAAKAITLAAFTIVWGTLLWRWVSASDHSRVLHRGVGPHDERMDEPRNARIPRIPWIEADFQILKSALIRVIRGIRGLRGFLSRLIPSRFHSAESSNFSPTDSAVAHLPGDVIFGCFFLLSAVVNPWYLLALLPFVVLRPSAWGVGALAVVTLSYAHGLYASEPSLAPYELPGWVRFLELSVVGVLLFVGRRWRRPGIVSAEGH